MCSLNFGFILADTYRYFFIFKKLIQDESITSHRKQENHIAENPLIDYVKSFIFFRQFAAQLDKIIISKYPEE